MVIRNARSTHPELDLNDIIAQHMDDRGVIKICKKAGQKKDAVRISCAADIPDFLERAVSVHDGKLYLGTTLEGAEVGELGSVVGYEMLHEDPKDPSSAPKRDKDGYIVFNVWVIGNAATNLEERDGEFFTKPTVFEAMAVPLSHQKSGLMLDFPEDKLHENRDGSWTYDAEWGAQTVFPGTAYLVVTGQEEVENPETGELEMKAKGYFITKGTESYQTFFLCEEDGTLIAQLADLDSELPPMYAGRTPKNDCA